MPESCTCTAEPGSCSASVAEHIRLACAVVAHFAQHYDRTLDLTPAELARVDQAAAMYRSVLRIQGVDPTSREQVGLFAVASSAQLAIMCQLHGGPYVAMAGAKMLVMSLPLIEELARG